jgi:hypothetical protein
MERKVFSQQIEKGDIGVEEISFNSNCKNIFSV